MLDTLAQSRTSLKRKPLIKLQGKGSDINHKSKITSGARRKTITQIIVSSLINIAMKKGDRKVVKH